MGHRVARVTLTASPAEPLDRADSSDASAIALGGLIDNNRRQSRNFDAVSKSA